MGYNIDRLKSQYGIGSASKLPYAGTPNPGTFAYSDDTNAANQAAELAAYNTQRADYLADQAAFDDYSDQFDQRLRNAPMYAQKQFDTSGRTAPLTRDDMYRKYLNRENELGGNQEVTAKDRQQFLRGAQQELANRGIDNLGSEYLLDDTGSYYGNVLDAPVYNYVAPLSPNVSEQLLPYGSGSQMGNRVINLPDGTPVTIPNTIIGPDGQVISTSTGFNIPSGLTAVPPNTPTYDALTVANANMAPIDIPNIAQINIPNIAPINIPPVMDVPAANVPMTDLPPVASLPSGYDSYLSEPPLNQAIVSNAADFDISQYNVPEYITGPYGSIISPDLYERYLPDPVVTEEITYDSLIPEYDTSEYMTDFNQQIIPESFYGSYFAEGGEVETDLDVNLDGDPLDMNILVEETVSAAPPTALGRARSAFTQMLQEPVAPPPAMVVEVETALNAGEPPAMVVETALNAGEQLLTERQQVIADLTAKYDQSQAASAEARANLIDQAGQGVSESEQWFRIASAFTKPTESGNFFESLGNVNETLGDIKAEDRLAQTQVNQALLADATLVEQQTLENLLRNEEIERRESVSKTTFAKEADDLGLTGNERLKFIQEGTDLAREKVRLANKKSKLAQTQLNNAELKLLAKEQDKLLIIRRGIDDLATILKNNDLIYTQSYGDQAAQLSNRIFNPDNPRYVMTRFVNNTLSENAISILKATFGGNISDGERLALVALQGVGAKSADERAEIVGRNLKFFKTKLAEAKDKIKSIKNRTFAQVTSEEE